MDYLYMENIYRYRLKDIIEWFESHLIIYITHFFCLKDILGYIWSLANNEHG